MRVPYSPKRDDNGTSIQTKGKMASPPNEGRGRRFPCWLMPCYPSSFWRGVPVHSSFFVGCPPPSSFGGCSHLSLGWLLLDSLSLGGVLLAFPPSFVWCDLCCFTCSAHEMRLPFGKRNAAPPKGGREHHHHHPKDWGRKQYQSKGGGQHHHSQGQTETEQEEIAPPKKERKTTPPQRRREGERSTTCKGEGKLVRLRSLSFGWLCFSPIPLWWRSLSPPRPPTTPHLGGAVYSLRPFFTLIFYMLFKSDVRKNKCA